MSKDLKECPFCGCEGTENKCNSFYIEFNHSEGCIMSGVKGIMIGINGSQAMIEAWNTRANNNDNRG